MRHDQQDIIAQEGLKRLLPCPFCGGGISQFSENGQMWTGKRYGDPISVSVRHWCDEPGPSRMIERVGRDMEHAIEKWNKRYVGTTGGD